MKKECTKIFIEALKIAIKTNVETGRKHLRHLPDSEYLDFLKVYEQITKNV